MNNIYNPVKWNEAQWVKLVRKTADEIVNNSTTLQNDNELLFTIAANEIWLIEGIVRINSAAAADFKYAFTVPGGCNGQKITALSSSSLTPEGGATTSTSCNTSGSNEDLRFKALFINGATAGTVQFQWAQNTADVSDSKVLANSVIIARRIG